MSRGIGAQCGLLMFGVAVGVGLIVGNSPTTILIRAIAAMIVASIVGQAAGWCAHLILAEYVRKTKQQIDERQKDAAIAATVSAEPVIETTEAA